MGNLPSNFFPYPELTDKRIFARAFTVSELRLISKADSLKDVSYLVRAVDLCITLDAGNLTIGDFYYMLMWLRLHSMPKTPYIMEWHCQEVVVVNKETKAIIPNDDNFAMPTDEDNYQIDPCATHNTEIIHMSNVEIVSLEDDFPGLPQEGAIEFDWPRARLLQDIQTSLREPELVQLVPAAQWVKDGNTIEEKIAIFETQNDLTAFDQALQINESIKHGVAEHTVLSCRRCMHKTPHQIHLDPLTFFR